MMIKQFFENLSYRMFKENDLSNITWTLCITCPLFRDYFIHFFFPGMDIEKSIILDREISKDGSRVNFIIHNKDETYNKFNNKSHNLTTFIR